MKRTVRTVAGKVNAVALAALMAALCFGMMACQPSAEEVIRQGVTKEFESLKNLDQSTIDEILGGVEDQAGLSQYGIDTEEFFRNWLDGFDYTIDNVAVDGNNATVTATITCKSLSDAFTTWSEGFEALSADAADMGEDELYQMIGSTLMEAIQAAPMTTTTIELPYVLNGNTWEPGPGFDSALGQGFIGDM